MIRIKPWLKATPAYPLILTARDALRWKSHGERIERRDARLTGAILSRLLRADDNCVDVGAHAGDVLAQFICLSPRGTHTAVEPIPHMAAALRTKFPAVEVHHAALSNFTGTCAFHVVTSSLALSGIRPRPDLPPNATVTRIEVPIVPLDELIPIGRPIRLIKIDVEGAELGVLRGGSEVLARCRPWVVFEHGSTSAAYGTTSDDVFEEIEQFGLSIWALGDWLASRPPLTRHGFADAVASGDAWNFLAGRMDHL